MRKGNKERIQQGKQQAFIEKVRHRLRQGLKDNNVIIAKLAGDYGIVDKDVIKELVELAIVLQARTMAMSADLSDRLKYDQITKLYRQQVNLTHRTSQSIMLQQYSTPAPLAFLASLFVKQVNPNGVFWEPSAGNGLLTIAIPPDQVVVNEIDDLRHLNLTRQGYRQVLQQDATTPITTNPALFDGVMTNPPFGKIDTLQFNEARIKVLDHAMAIRALEKMKDDGRAAIIVGGHLTFDQQERIQAGKNMIFYAYLHRYYHVLDSINIDGSKLYSRQGTAFDVRLILIEGRKSAPAGFPPMQQDKDKQVMTSFDQLWNRVATYLYTNHNIAMNTLERDALALEIALLHNEVLEGTYYPASRASSLEVEVPDSMDYETHQAIARIAQAVGDIDEYVRQKLGFRTKQVLYKALMAEQIDAVAMAIYNMEVKKQGIIIGDQTGIGKGRQAAAIIRYAVNAGYMPIFLTEKPNLFTDIYRDLSDIGSGELKPFIVNARDSKTDIKDTDGKVVYRAMEAAAQKKLYDKFKQGKGSLADLKGHDYVIGLYSQFRDKDITAKQIFLRVISKNNVIIMDEAHNSSGSSNTGSFLQNIAAAADGVTFLSATFAKRPDNMPIYAMKTAISDANMSKTELVEAIVRGGVALQEVLASQLVDEGQMVRRQRSFEGIEVNYINLTEQKQQHRATCDRITEIMRDIINFQKKHVTPAIKEMDKAVREEGKKVVERAGTSQAGVNNTPYFSKIFNVINQLLFSVKAEAVAQQAIQRLKEGKKPVLAFSSTMGSFLKDMSAVSTGDETGEKVSPGSVVSADFTEVLRKGLQGVLRITTADAFGNKTYEQLNISDFDDAAQMEYLNILKKINRAASGICISPIDVLTKRLTEAGYTYGEVTGRDIELQLDDHLKTGMPATGIIQTRKKISATDAFRKFNNNELDCLLINQSGSTGASAHAVPTKKVSATQVKQRVMIVLQAELDINTEVQKRGRINRTGQIKKPIYDYLISEIPAENRLMMMLQKKLKSLDANTSSDQKNSEALLSTADFLNKYGDNVVHEYLSDNAELNALLGDPLLLNDGNTKVLEGGAHKVSGLVAVLSTQDQEKFYNDILERYNELVAYKQQLGEYDLEVEAMDLQAETLKSQVVKVGKNANSVFGDDSFLETVRAKVLKKPFTAAEVQNMLAQTLAGKEAREIQAEIVEGFQEFAQKQLSEEQAENLSRYQHQLSHVENEKAIQKIDNPQIRRSAARQEAIEQRRKELHQAMITRGKHLVDMYEKNISHISSILNFFYPGRAIKYPKLAFGEGSSFVWGICLGLQIDEKRPNPYAPSAITVRFALASSDKFVALKLSGETGNQVMAIKGATYDISNSEANTLLERWDEIIKEASADFTTRHIITGNLLQAMASYRGKLVSYTSANNDIKKGILLPEQFNPEEDIKGKVEVPLFKALKVIRALPSGQVLVTSNNIGFLRQGEDYKIILPAARKHGGDIYLNQKILDLTEEGTFNKAGDRMVAWVRAERIADFIQVVQDEYSPSLEVTAEQFKLIETSLEKRKAKPVMDMPGQRKLPAMPAMEDEEMMLILELEAQALELELNLNRQVA